MSCSAFKLLVRQTSHESFQVKTYAVLLLNIYDLLFTMAPRYARHCRRAPRTRPVSTLREMIWSLVFLYLLVVPHTALAVALQPRVPFGVPSGPSGQEINGRSQELNPISEKIPTVKNKDDSWIPNFSPLANDSKVNDYDDEAMSATSHIYLPGLYNARHYISNGCVLWLSFPSGIWFLQKSL